MVQLYLKIDRLKYAEKELAEMQKTEDENTLTQLASAWISLYQATPDKAKDAFYIYNDLVEKFGPTPVTLTGLACCNLESNNSEDGVTNLKEALEKDPKFPEALINLSNCYAHQGKVTLTNRLLSQVKANNPGHSFLRLLQQFDSDFDTHASKYAPEAN